MNGTWYYRTLDFKSISPKALATSDFFPGLLLEHPELPLISNLLPLL